MRSTNDSNPNCGSRLRPLAGLVLVLIAMGPLARVLTDPSWVAGIVRSSQEVGTVSLARVDQPTGDPVLSITDARTTRGDLIVGRGRVEVIAGNRCMRMDGGAWVIPLGRTRALATRALPDVPRDGAVILLAASLIVLSTLASRLLGALCLGAVGASSGWLGTVVLAGEELARRPEPFVQLAVAAAGCVLGAALGLRGGLAPVARRLGVLTVLLLAFDRVTGGLPWPGEVTGPALTALAMISPRFGQALISAGLVAGALGAGAAATIAVLGTAIVVTLVLQTEGRGPLRRR